MTREGICAVDPKINIKDSLFCFTGKSSKASRRDFSELIIKNGGQFNNNVISNTDYLIIGNAGNPCWTFSCYGRKVEKAVKMRQEGRHIMIINELDFWDAIN